MMAQFGTGKNPPWARTNDKLGPIVRRERGMMAQFGTGKNPPWARTNDMPGQGLVANLAQQQVNVGGALLSQPGVAQPTVYSLQTSQPALQQHQYAAQQIQVANVQQQALQPQQQNAVLPQPGIAIPTTLATTQVATVSYPTPRAAQQAQQPKQRVFTGTVSKLHENFGFVDEDVFFQTSCVKGSQPKVGDRVLVEATYNANMPFKWNATRIQVLPNQSQPGVDRYGMPDRMHNSGVDRYGMPERMHSGPPPNWQHQQHKSSSSQNWHNKGPQQNVSGFGPPSGGLLKPPGVSPSITPSSITQGPPPLMGQPTQPSGGPRPGMPPSRRPEPPSYRDRGMEGRDRGRDRDRHREDRRDRRSPRKRSRSPRRSRSPSSRTRSPPRRRPARIIPRYMVQVPKLSLDSKEANVIMLKSRYSNLYVPSDFFNASFSWTEGFPLHRPFQLGHPCTFHIMSKEVQSTQTNDAVLEPSDADHLFSAKVMLLSNPLLEEVFHKSCAMAEDSAEVREAFQHPTRLIQFLVGLKGKSEPMAIGGPWSPSLDGPNPNDDPGVLIKTAIRTTRALTGIDLSSCTQWYRFAEIRYHRPEEMHKGRLVPARVETVVIFLPDVWSCNPTRLEWETLQAAYKKQLMDKIAEETKEDQQEEEEDGEGSAEKKDPTHHSELDPRTMKVADLRRELECRNLSSKGLKSQLIARLTKAIKSELEKEEQEAEQEKEEDEHKPEEEDERPGVDEKEEERKKKEEEERKRREERDKVARERKYTLPENPAILIHPSPTAKSGKFDCTAMSLSLLLDYRPEDNKEHSFEVSLFAELFNEMLMRDFGFRIYKSLVAAPEKKEEKKEKEKDKDKEGKEKDRDHKDSKDKDSKERDSKDKDVKDKEKKDKDKKDDRDKEKEADKEDEKEDREKESKEKDTDDKEKESEEKDPENGKEKEEPTTKKRKVEKEKEAEEEEDMDDEDEAEDHEHADKSKEKRRDSSKKREKVRYRTVDPGLLLAFVYFDQTHTGYILDKDIEELIHTLGLHLSRAQVKRLVQKVVHRDTLNYRKVTDKPDTKDMDKKEEKETEEDMAVDSKDDTKEEGKDRASSDKSPAVTDEELAQGNRGLMRRASDMADQSPTSKGRVKKGEDEAQGFVMYNGALVDIPSIMQRLEKSEKTRTATESKLKDIQEDLEELRTSFSSSEQNSQKVALELQDLKKKLREQKKLTEAGEFSSKKFQEAILKSRGTLTTIISDMDKALSGTSVNNKTDVKVKQEEVKVKTESKTPEAINGK